MTVDDKAETSAPAASSSGGVAATHPGRAKVSLPVAATDQTRLNTLRLSLFPIACWKLEDLRFDFDSSFIKPEGKDEFAALLELRKQHAGAPISIFGHADPSGKDDYNKTLSGRRALGVHAVLVRDVARWEALFSDSFQGDEWGTRSIQHMLLGLGFEPGLVDGKLGTKTRGAVRSFQTRAGLGVDGEPGPLTRKALFAAYMDFLCCDQQGTKITLVPADFLARGADGDLRGDVQGCSEFNPILVLSKAEDEAFAKPERKTERDAALLPDRRVMVFLFTPGVSIEPARWPCPAAKDGPSKCQAQFYPDGDKRRSASDVRRTYAETHDTMACRFYDRMARASPCETARSALILRLLNEDGEVIPEAQYRVRLASGELRSGQAAKDGWLIEQNVASPEKVLVEWGYPPEFGITDEERAKRWGYPGPFGYKLEVLLDATSVVDEEAQAALRLRNLGYSADRTLEENLVAFQRDYQIFPADGKLETRTKDALKDAADDALTRAELVKKNGGKAS